MLSQAEISKRKTYYEEKFGEERVLSAAVFPILLCPISNYDEKVRGLAERGFKDPKKMIASFPPILGYTFKNIDAKIKKVRRLKASPTSFIEYNVLFIGMSPKHYIPIVRKCRELNLEFTPKNIFKIYRDKSF